MAPRGMFELQLNDLQDELIIMGSMVQKAIARSIDALNNRDFDLAEFVVKGDEGINEKRFTIEEKCVTLIATQQPMAIDLRMIISAMHVATDLERIGDYASGIAEITLLLQHDSSPNAASLADIGRMSDIGMAMLEASLQAFINRDVERAREIGQRDDDMDSRYHKVLSQSIDDMIQHPTNVTVATRTIWVAHKLERIGDRVTNICERVIYMATGQMEEIDGP